MTLSEMQNDVFVSPEFPKFMEESWRRTDPEQFFVPKSEVVCPNGSSVEMNLQNSSISPWKIQFKTLPKAGFEEKLQRHFSIVLDSESGENQANFMLSENAVFVEVNDVSVAVFVSSGSLLQLDDLIELSSKTCSETFGAVAPDANGRSRIGAQLTRRLEQICGYQLQLNLKLLSGNEVGQLFVTTSEACQFNQSHLILNLTTAENSKWNVAFRQYGTLHNHTQHRVAVGNNSTLGTFFWIHSKEGTEDSVSLTERKVSLGTSAALVDGIVAHPRGEHRFISNIFFEGEHSTAECATAVLNSGYASFDYEPIHEHCSKNSSSQLRSHYVARDSSRTHFQGLVDVPLSGTGTNAVQINKNLILSKDARVDSLPRLKILPNEVSCKHGSASGELDPQALFYLLSRGFSEQESSEMLIASFAVEPFTKHLNATTQTQAAVEFVQGLGVAHVASAVR
jgi:Fe-S cluster assembly protein SufD